MDMEKIQLTLSGRTLTFLNRLADRVETTTPEYIRGVLIRHLEGLPDHILTAIDPPFKAQGIEGYVDVYVAPGKLNNDRRE